MESWRGKVFSEKLESGFWLDKARAKVVSGLQTRRSACSGSSFHTMAERRALKPQEIRSNRMCWFLHHIDGGQGNIQRHIIEGSLERLHMPLPGTLTQILQVHIRDWTNEDRHNTDPTFQESLERLEGFCASESENRGVDHSRFPSGKFKTFLSKPWPLFRLEQKIWDFLKYLKHASLGLISQRFYGK